MKLTQVSILLFSAAIALPAGKARSAETEQRPHGPPAEAFDACSGRASGDACSVTFGDRTIKGTCKPMPQDDRLVCWPDQPPPGPPPDQSGR
jgi:hypothetical protein